MFQGGMFITSAQFFASSDGVKETRSLQRNTESVLIAYLIVIHCQRNQAGFIFGMLDVRLITSGIKMMTRFHGYRQNTPKHRSVNQQPQ